MNISPNIVKSQSTNSQYSLKTIDDLQSQCLSHMAGNEIYLNDSIYTDGKIHRFQVGLKRNKDGWYIAWNGISIKDNPYLICIYGSWKMEGKFEYRSWLDNLTFDDEERRELQRHLKEKQEATKTAIKLEQDLVAKECQCIWEEAEKVNPTEKHLEYLGMKGVKNYGLGFGNNEKGYPSIIIPLKNTVGEIRSMQYISVGQDGTVYKSFHTGGERSGNYFIIGSIANGQQFYVCEGYATGASPHEALGHPVVVAFDCKSLSAVIENLRKIYPESKITILADDDRETTDQQGNLINPGKKAAEEAARHHRCDFILPEFSSDFRLPNGKLPSDFNDLHVHFGLNEVKKQIEKKVFLFWDEPKPIQQDLVPVPPFDFENLFPNELSNFVKDESDRMVCSPDFIAAALLVSLGSVIGARCAIRPKSKDDWVIVPNLWGGCVGAPTTKKSPAIAAAMKPLIQLAKKARERHQEAVSTYEADKIVFAAKKEVIETNLKNEAKKKTKSNIDQVARELQTHQKKAPNSPLERRYKTNDTTIEKLGVMLSENPQGLLILRDEIVGLLVSWDKTGHEGDRTFFMESHNGVSDFNTDRIGRNNIYIPNLCTSIFGGIQPDKLLGYLEQAANALGNDGMLQRFQILVYPDSPKWEWRDRSPNIKAREEVCAIFETLADFDPLEWGASPKNDYCKFPYFHFDEEAQNIFIEWMEGLHTKILPNEDNTLISQHIGKYEKLFPALALIFHLVDCTKKGNIGSIKKASAIKAANWCTYLEAHARRCYGLLADDGLRAAQALATKLSKAKLADGFTARDVRRNQWRYLTNDMAVQSALDWLEDEGWLKSYEVGGRGPGSGRPTFRYKINPKIKNSHENQEDDHEDQNFS
jgi:phage/plasmid primase-like uncharacterized protein